MSAITDIQAQGWTTIDFPMSIKERADYTKLGNKVIDLALATPKIYQALTLTVGTHTDARAVQANTYTVSPALHSADDKLWIHAGYQTLDHVNAAIPKSEQPDVLKEYLAATQKVLASIEEAFKKSLSAINADPVADIIFDADVMKRAIHIRIVRYNGARRKEAPPEPVTGHADMGLCTLHLFETHGNWFQAAPYDQSIIIDEHTPQRDKAVAEMRSKLKVIKEIDDKAIFFLGAGWNQLPKNVPPKDYQQLPACYHAGIRPSIEDEYVSPFAKEVAGNDVDRVSLVVFSLPNQDYVKDYNYVYASVSQCRPDTAVEL